MAEELENKKSPEQESPQKQTEPATQERSWGKAAADVAGNMVDALARGGRLSSVLGAGLQAGFNTDEFQAKKLRLAREYAAENRAAESHNMAKERHSMAMKMGDVDLQRKQLALDDAYRKEQMAVVMDNMRTEFNVNPAYGWNTLTTAEQNDIMNSPAVQNMARGNYIFRELLRSRGDTESWERFKRYAGNYGGKVSDDGKGNYTLEIFGRSIPLNEQEGLKLHKNLQDAMMGEINARRGISYSATKGNVIGKIQADNIKHLIPYTGGSALKASDIVKKTIEGMTPDQRYTMFARRTLEDQFNPGVGNDEKMAEAEMALAKDPNGMSILERMGFTFNPGKAGVADATVTPIGQPNAAPMTMPQFLSYLKERDTGSQILDAQAKTVKDEYELKQKAFILKNMRQTGEGLSGTEGKSDVISEEDNRRGFLRYGSNAWSRMTPELKKKVFSAENEVANMALYYGVAENKNGKVVLKPGITQEQIKEMRAIERNIFEREGLGDHYKKGFWAQMKDIAKPVPVKADKIPSGKEKKKDEVWDLQKQEMAEKYGQSLMDK